MNYQVYRMYVESQNMVKALEENKANLGDEELNLLADMKLSQSILNEANLEYLRRYNMEQKMYSSFTPEQRDFICAQIGHWYLMMKPLLEGQHNLGHMKEVLKMMICGDE